jgi:hypothetical protein
MTRRSLRLHSVNFLQKFLTYSRSSRAAVGTTLSADRMRLSQLCNANRDLILETRNKRALNSTIKYFIRVPRNIFSYLTYY